MCSVTKYFLISGSPNQPDMISLTHNTRGGVSSTGFHIQLYRWGGAVFPAEGGGHGPMTPGQMFPCDTLRDMVV